MKKNSMPSPVLFMTKAKFAIVVNIMIISALIHHAIAFAGKSERVFYSIFMAVLVYFIASSTYSLYFDIFEK